MKCVKWEVNNLVTKRTKLWLGLGMSLLLAAGIAAGCKQQQAGQAPQQPTEVKVMQVLQQDTPLTYEYVGQVKAEQEVQLKAKVSGNIVAKMVQGGATVHKGQPLFQLDQRQYQSAILSARAQLVQAEAAYNNAHLDTLRYQKLASQQAVAQQTVDTQMATEAQQAALVDVYRAKLQQAEEDLQDTYIVSPIDGRIDVNDLSTGSFVSAGSTVMATISSFNPVFVQFGMNENEYLKVSQSGGLPDAWGQQLTLLLSNGTKYALPGKVTQVDRGIDEANGTLTLKASFDNPQRQLVPGMFARIQVQGETLKNALVIPQRAVQELLGKTFVTVVGEDGKTESRAVKLGAKTGILYVVEEGLSAQDRVVVEGSMKLQPGAVVNATAITLADLQNTAKQ